MCIIAAKPAGVTMPDKKTRQNMWTHNPDGAGFMYVKDGKVIIEKGFMKLKELERRLDKLSKEIDFKKTPMILHFRTTTHGGTSPENCHPFPITDSIAALRKCRNACTIGVAHNGIIDIRTPKDRSDTMQYIATQLAPLRRALPKFYENKDALQLVKNAIDSKMAFLNYDGKIITVGDFVEHEGVTYSNKSYEAYSRYQGFTCDWYDDDNWTNFPGYKSYVSTKTKVIPKDPVSKDAAKITQLACASKLDDENDDPGYVIVSDSLMWLDAVNGYVIKPDGTYDDGDLYLLDADNLVYCYDFDIDAAVPVFGYSALTGGGLMARYDDSLSTVECVVEYDYADDPWATE